MTENQATLTKTQHPGQLGACCENEIHVSESIRISQAWFIQKCHNPFLTLHGHVHHTDSRELKYMKFISCAYKIHLSSDSYMKGEARIRDKMPLGTSAWDICWGIVWIVSFLHGRSQIETKQWGFFQNKERSCGLHSQFPSEVFHMEEENLLKWVRERWRLAFSYKPQWDAIPLKNIVIMIQVLVQELNLLYFQSCMVLCSWGFGESGKFCKTLFPLQAAANNFSLPCPREHNTLALTSFLGNMLSRLLSYFVDTLQEA